MKLITQRPYRYIGLSTDTKPTDGPVGSTFLEYDTGSLFAFDGNWTLKAEPAHLFETTTIDLEQAAGGYTLFTAPATDIQVLELGIIIPADLTGDAGGDLDSIAIASTDASPVVFLAADPDGLQANLAENRHFVYNGADTVGAGITIRLTIAGGPTSAEQVCHVWIKYQEVF